MAPNKNKEKRRQNQIAESNAKKEELEKQKAEYIAADEIRRKQAVEKKSELETPKDVTEQALHTVKNNKKTKKVDPKEIIEFLKNNPGALSIKNPEILDNKQSLKKDDRVLTIVRYNTPEELAEFQKKIQDLHLPANVIVVYKGVDADVDAELKNKTVEEKLKPTGELVKEQEKPHEHNDADTAKFNKTTSFSDYISSIITRFATTIRHAFNYCFGNKDNAVKHSTTDFKPTTTPVKKDENLSTSPISIKNKNSFFYLWGSNKAQQTTHKPPYTAPTSFKSNNKHTL